MEVEAAELIAILAYYGQTTQTGEPYITHPAAVAAMVLAEYKATAWLHDVLEDSEFSEGHLLAAGIKPSTIQAVKIVSHNLGETYAEFINRIVASGNLEAVTVKLADVQHNLRVGCPDHLAKRYRKAEPILMAALLEATHAQP